MRNAFVDELVKLANKDERIYLLTADLGYNVLNSFWDRYPSRFINTGISEQNMTSMAAGIALEGKTVFTYSIGNFSTLRCLEQIRNDVAYHNANVNIVSVGAGFAYGSLGMSHHATEDIAIMRALPGLYIFSPADSCEARAITEFATKNTNPCYIRLGKGKEPIIHNEDDFKFKCGKIYEIRKGDDIAILCTGEIINEALSAAERLGKEGIEANVYSVPTIKPIDDKLIKELGNKFENIITLEEHNIIGGLGSAVAEILCQEKNNNRLIRMGINDEYSCIVGNQEYLRKQYRISEEDIFNKVKNIIGKGE